MARILNYADKICHFVNKEVILWLTPDQPTLCGLSMNDATRDHLYTNVGHMALWTMLLNGEKHAEVTQWEKLHKVNVIPCPKCKDMYSLVRLAETAL